MGVLSDFDMNRVVSCGTGTTLLLNSEGVLCNSGLNQNLQLGFPNMERHCKKHSCEQCQKMLSREYFQEVAMVAAEKPLFISVHTSGSTSFGLTTENIIFSWGSNKNGQLGQGDADSRCLPGKVVFYYMNEFSTATMPKIKQISCGIAHVLALSVDGLVMACGDNRRGQLGCAIARKIKKTTRFVVVYPVALESETTETHLEEVVITHQVRLIAAGTFVSGMVHENNELWMWGCNMNCQIAGVDTAESAVVQATPRVVRLRNDEIFLVSSMSFGHEHCACIKTDNSVWTWGFNSYGKLGNDATFNYNNNNAHQHNKISSIPKKIVSVPLMTDTAVEVSCGGSQTLIRTANGALWASGCYDLGTGLLPMHDSHAGTFRQVPLVKHNGLDQIIVAMSAGKTHSALVTADNVVLTCGKMKCVFDYIIPASTPPEKRCSAVHCTGRAKDSFVYHGFGGLGYFSGAAREGFVHSFRPVQQIANSMAFYDSFSKDCLTKITAWLLGIYHDKKPQETKQMKSVSVLFAKKNGKGNRKDTHKKQAEIRTFSRDRIMMNALGPDAIDSIIKCLRTDTIPFF